MTALALLAGAGAGEERDANGAGGLARAERCLARRAAREGQRYCGTGLAAYVARSTAAPVVAELGGPGESNLWVAFAGRLDDSEHLGRELGAAAGASAPELVAALWLRDREHALARLSGSFILALVDRSADETWLARDWIGAHCLFYRHEGARLLVASEALAVLAMAGIAPREDDATVAALLGNASPAAGATCFIGVRSLLPGQALRFHGGRLEPRELGNRPRPLRLAFAGLADASSGFLEALTTATARTLAGARSPAVSLSGGVDSTAIAVAMSRSRGAGVRSYTWTLPGYPDADEAPFVRAAAAKLKLDARIFDAESLGPRLDAAWPVWTDAPLGNPYRLIKQEMYRQAADDGTDVLLDGVYGDSLYPQPSRWLIDALSDRRPDVARAQLLHLFQDDGVRAIWRDAGLRGLVKRLIGRRLMRYETLEWLREPWRSTLAGPTSWPPWRGECRDPGQCRGLMGLDICDDAPPEAWFADPLGLSVRHPYRDAGLIAFMLGLPAYWVTVGGDDKAIARAILRTQLPASISSRPKSGSLEPFASHWLWVRQAERVEALLLDGPRHYERFIEPAAVAMAYANRFIGDESFTLLLWSCISYELWKQAYTQTAKW